MAVLTRADKSRGSITAAAGVEMDPGPTRMAHPGDDRVVGEAAITPPSTPGPATQTSCLRRRAASSSAGSASVGSLVSLA